MAATHRIALTCANIFTGSEVVTNARHVLPRVDLVYTGDYISAVKEITGTGSHTFSNDATNLSDGVDFFEDPLTQLAFNFDNTETVGIVVGRENPSTAPTGTVTFTSAGFGGLGTPGDTSVVELKENAVFLLHNPDLNSTDTHYIIVDLTGTTGYKVSVLLVLSTD
jgi:hypothetical protein